MDGGNNRFAVWLPIRPPPPPGAPKTDLSLNGSGGEMKE